MRVRVHQGLVHMGVAVRAHGHRVVPVGVVAVVVAVRVLVLQPFMRVFVGV